MANTITIKKGLEANRAGITPLEGELLYTTDDKKIYIGDGVTSGGNPVSVGVEVGLTLPSPVSDEGSLFYQSDTDSFYISNGTQWSLVFNAAPATTGGTVVITELYEGGTFAYNLGLDFADDYDTDSQLTYTLVNGTLPSGCVLPTAGNSALTGTAPLVSSDTSYSWTISAADTSGKAATQSYQQIIKNVVPTATGGTVAITGADGGTAISYDVDANFTFATGSTLSAFSVQGGALPSGTTLNTSTGVISGTVVDSTTTYTFTIRATDTDGDVGDQNYTWVITEYVPSPSGQWEYSTPGVHSWVAPTGVTSVSVVCVGGGGRGQSSGSGSHLGQPDGGNSSVLGVIAYGGSGGAEGATSGTALGGGYGGNAQGGGFGGDGHLQPAIGATKVGGAGAGGYSGKGGNAGQSDGGCNQVVKGGDGAGGAGAGGGGWSPGAGVGIYGEGASGIGFTHSPHACPNSTEPGTGGSGGEDAPGWANNDTHAAGAFGGGGESNYSRVGGGGGGLAWANALTVTPGTSYSVEVGLGGKTRASSWASHGGGGAVRIIYGDNRAFPSTNTANQ